MKNIVNNMETQKPASHFNNMLSKMHVIEEQYEINRISLKMLGLWPYNESCLTLIQKLLLAGILFTFITVQVA
jgi:hypothetical protein